MNLFKKSEEKKEREKIQAYSIKLKEIKIKEFKKKCNFIKSDETCSLIVYGQYHRFCNFDDCIFQKILKKLEEK